MVVALELLAAFVLIVFGAILAAVGTALPESIIPVVALARNPGDPEAVEIAIGAIIGAPFLLGTVAMLLVAASAMMFRERREQDDRVEIHPESTRRDRTSSSR